MNAKPTLSRVDLPQDEGVISWDSSLLNKSIVTDNILVALADVGTDQNLIGNTKVRPVKHKMIEIDNQPMYVYKVLFDKESYSQFLRLFTSARGVTFVFALAYKIAEDTYAGYYFYMDQSGGKRKNRTHRKNRKNRYSRHR